MIKPRPFDQSEIDRRNADIQREIQHENQRAEFEAREAKRKQEIDEHITAMFNQVGIDKYDFFEWLRDEEKLK